MEIPDRWVVLKIGNIYKVLAGWAGGYFHGDSWRLNSGIVRVEAHEGYWDFHGYSGSVYRCRTRLYGTSLLMDGILNTLRTQAASLTPEVTISIMPPDTDYNLLEYTS